MRILIATTHVPFVEGGAEAHCQRLEAALRAAGHSVDTARIPFKWYPPERVPEHVLANRLLDVTESNGVPIDLLIGMKFPAYHLRHPRKVHWIIHQHRTAFEMYGSEHCDLSPHACGAAVRDSIAAIERKLLPEARACYANSRTVAQRISHFCDLEVPPLYHPPHPPGERPAFHCKDPEPFLYFPSRLNAWKRQDLAIRALAESSASGRLVISGAPDHPDFEAKLKALARECRVADRVDFLGRVDFPTMLDLYSRCSAVVFPPNNEDYGYITLEAMLSSKPVLTTDDAGGPTEFVEDGVTGRITAPTPKALAGAFDEALRSPHFSKSCGAAALARYHALNISWDHVVQTLLSHA